MFMISETLPISYQINLSPSDYPLCQKLLETQIKYFYASIDEIVLTLETKKSIGNRFGNGFESNKDKLNLFLLELAKKYPKIRIAPVDYSDRTKEIITKKFFNNANLMPDKDFRGGPFYCYFYGLNSCKNNYVLHMDCDMFLGGQPEVWLRRAFKLISQKDIYFVNPLPGPPTPDFSIKQPYKKRINRYLYYFNHVTTRFFLTDIEKITSKRLELSHVHPLKLITGLKQKNYWEIPEKIFSNFLKKEKGWRANYWGEDDQFGCYSLHPIRKPESFIEFIPSVLEKISLNDLPVSQMGCYDIQRELFDFGEQSMYNKLKSILR
jgi:hypothetical protein